MRPGIAALAVLLAATAVRGEPPSLAASTDVSDTGAYRLSWEPNGIDVVVEEAERADFAGARTLYEGPDGATVVSGRLDGTYHYRVRRAGEGDRTGGATAGGAWSPAVQVSVVHHDLRKALAFLAVGAAVFLGTAVLILAGHRRHRRAFRPDGDAPA